MKNNFNDTPRLLPVENTWIDRESIIKTSIQLRDNDGSIYYDFPLNWSDEQILYALKFANHAYHIGFLQGKKVQGQRIRNLLDGE